jgi:hypothetical protein
MAMMSTWTTTRRRTVICYLMPHVGRYLTAGRAAIAAALTAPLATAAILLPFRASWSNTNVALLLARIIHGL